jgi:hypothetical protein
MVSSLLLRNGTGQLKMCGVESRRNKIVIGGTNGEKNPGKSGRASLTMFQISWAKMAIV